MEDEITFLRKKLQELEAEVKRLKSKNENLVAFIGGIAEDIRAETGG